MTITAFQKGNRKAVAESVKASVYTPSGINTNTNAGTQATIQQTVPWAFKGNGQVEVTLPFGFTLPNGVSVGTVSLVQGASPYAAGTAASHPIVQYTLVTSLAANQVCLSDTFIVQY